MNYLGVDTSTHIASIGLWYEGAFFLEQQDNIRTHAASLLPMIARVLKKASCTFHQIDGLVVGHGPGSFTGLRVAVSHVKGLALAHNLPVYSLSTLKSIAEAVWGGRSNDANVLSVLDARMNQLYWAVYEPQLNITQEYVTNAEAIAVPGNSPLILAGVGFEEYFPLFPDALKQRIVRTVEVYPSVEEMINLVLEGKCEPTTAAGVLPIYIRNSVTQ